MREMSNAALLLSAVLLVPVQEKKTVKWEDLKAGPRQGARAGVWENGSRVKVTLRNGNTLRGYVVHPAYVKILDKRIWRPKPLDFSKAVRVTLDLSLEYPELTGFVTLKKSDLKMPIYELSPLDQATLRKIQEAKRQAKLALREAAERLERRREKEREEREKAIKAAAEEAEKAKLAQGLEGQKAKLEKLEKALEFYQRFPEGSLEEQKAGTAWGPERIKMIKQKSLLLTPPSASEQEFLTNYDQWLIGKNYAAEQRKKKEERE